jgi:uncharacterized UPF0160 family protein
MNFSSIVEQDKYIMTMENIIKEKKQSIQRKANELIQDNKNTYLEDVINEYKSFCNQLDQDKNLQITCLQSHYNFLNNYIQEMKNNNNNNNMNTKEINNTKDKTKLKIEKEKEEEILHIQIEMNNLLEEIEKIKDN